MDVYVLRLLQLSPLEERIDPRVAVEYGGWKPWQLRTHIYNLLDLAIPEKRNDYAGLYIENYFKAEKFKLKKKSCWRKLSDGDNRDEHPRRAASLLT